MFKQPRRPTPGGECRESILQSRRLEASYKSLLDDSAVVTAYPLGPKTCLAHVDLDRPLRGYNESLRAMKEPLQIPRQPKASLVAGHDPLFGRQVPLCVEEVFYR